MGIVKSLTMALSAITLSTISLSSQAGLISDYSLDSDTRIVTDSHNNLEWLQWSVTQGQSIADAFAQYASDGWEVASSSHIADLFNTFDLSYGEFTWQAGVANAYEERDDGYTESASDRELQFVSLFGSTSIKDYIQLSAAKFSDEERNGYAYIQDDYQPDSDSGFYNNWTRVGFGGVGPNISIQQQYGVALIRSSSTSNSVPEPSALALLSLALVGVGLRRRKAK